MQSASILAEVHKIPHQSKWASSTSRFVWLILTMLQEKECKGKWHPVYHSIYHLKIQTSTRFNNPILFPVPPWWICWVVLSAVPSLWPSRVGSSLKISWWRRCISCRHLPGSAPEASGCRPRLWRNGASQSASLAIASKRWDMAWYGPTRSIRCIPGSRSNAIAIINIWLLQITIKLPSGYLT